jgi:hypothetical protein
MLFMAELSEALNAPSEFRLLNGADPIIVGMGDDRGESLKFLREVMEDSPAGPTPLCTQLNAVVESILSVADVLKANNQKVTVMIATDGESSDGNVADALRPLTNVRAWLYLHYLYTVVGVKSHMCLFSYFDVSTGYTGVASNLVLCLALVLFRCLLRSPQLPVLVILRLCTSEEKVVTYWNNIDQQLELDIDVLDNQHGDARQVSSLLLDFFCGAVLR